MNSFANTLKSCIFANMRNVIIYALICPMKNEIKYIGKTVNLNKRLDRHRRDASKKGRKNKLYSWYKSIINNNHNVNYEIIDIVLESEWSFWEDFYIQYFKYIGCDLKNSQSGGINPTRKPLTEEHKKKISLAQIGIPKRKGWHHTKEHKLK